MASEYVDDVEDIAARVMYELLGRRWVYPFLETTETVHLPAGSRLVVLHGRPVQDVHSVVLTGTTTELEWTLENKHRLRLTTAPVSAGVSALSRYRSPCNNPRSVDVHYTYGAQPPIEVLYAIETMASEMRKAMEEDETCRLPARVTSVTRNGMSMTLLDPQDFLDDGMTGIEEIDAALSRYNPTRAKRPARVYGRMSPPPIRINTVRT